MCAEVSGLVVRMGDKNCGSRGWGLGLEQVSGEDGKWRQRAGFQIEISVVFPLWLRVMNPSSIQEDSGLIPGPVAQWFKDLGLP